MKAILRHIQDLLIDFIAFVLICAALAIIIIICAPYARAADIGFNIATQHNRGTNDGQRLRTFTPGAYYRADNGATGGLFINSFGHPALLLGISPELRLARQWSAAVTGGAVIGYRHDAFIPAAIPSVRRDIGSWGGVRLAYLPRRPGEKHGVEAITLSLEITQ